MQFEDVDWTQLAQNEVEMMYACEHGDWFSFSVVNALYVLTT